MGYPGANQRSVCAGERRRKEASELLTQAEAQRGGLCGDEAGPVITFGTLAERGVRHSSNAGRAVIELH